MQLLQRFHERWGFTPNETRTVLLLGLTFVAGAVVRSVRLQPDESSALDYRASDSLFAALTEEGRQNEAATRDVPAAPVDINSAGRQDLLRLPGIGAAYADRIIDYRTRNGPFGSIEELTNVRGIGPKTLARLRPHVRVAHH